MNSNRKSSFWRNFALAFFATLTAFLGLAQSSRGQTPPCALMIATNVNLNAVNAMVSVPWAFTGVYKSNALVTSYCSNYISSSSAAGVPIGSYACWCVDWDDNIEAGPSNYTAHVLATCDPNLNVNLTNLYLWHDAGLWTNPDVYVSPATWQKVNYLINHRGSSFFYDVQIAIWHYVGARGPTEIYDPFQPIFNPPNNTNDWKALIAAADANAASWTPKCGDVQGVILAINRYPVAIQLLMIEVPIPCTTSVAVSKTVACLLPGNSCGTFSKLAAGYKGTADPGFCYQIVVSNPGTITLTNLTVSDNMVGDITTNFFPNPHSSLAPGASITNFFKMSWDVTTTNTVTVSAASTKSLTNIVSATDSAVAKVDTAAVTCNVSLTAPCDLDGRTNDNHVLLPGCGGVCAVTFNVLVCNPSAVNLTNVTITSPALAALDCSLPAPFNLPAGTCINYQCTASLTCPGAPLNVNVSVVASVQTDSAHCGYDISSVTPVQVVSTCNGMVECAPTTSGVSGYLFLDCSSTPGQNHLNNNPGPGLSGCTVNLLDGSSNIIATTVSGTNGAYAFTNLPFANYRVAVVSSTNVVQTYSVSGINNNQMDVGATNCAGASYVNFGYRDNLSASVNSGTVCDGTPLSMTATVGGNSGPYTYAWTGPSGFTANTATISATAAGVYSVTATDTNGCSATGMGTLTVNPAPSVSVNSGSVCAGSSLSLVAKIVGGTGPFTYAWTGPAGFTAGTASVNVSAAGSYNVTVTDANGCSGSGAGVLTINPTPSVLVNSGAVCAGASLTMTASVTSGTAPYTYAWTGPNGFSAATASISASAAGIYSVTVTDGNGCSGSGSGILTVNPKPTVTINSGSVFQGNSLVMTATVVGGVGPFNYAWTGPNGFTASTPSITVSVAGTYAVNIIDANGCSNDPALGHGILTVIPPVTIGNFVWDDVNGDGVQDAGEPGIAGVTVTLTGTDINGGAVNASTVTDGNGLYSFSEPPGTYTVTAVTPAGYVATATGMGTTATDSNPNGTTVTLAAGGSDTTIDFGYYLPVIIDPYVWNDSNGNGIHQDGEPNIPGVTVILTGTDGTGNRVHQTTITDTNGAYSFTAPPGTYTVSVVTPLGYLPTFTEPGAAGTVSQTNHCLVFLPSGGSVTNLDFGFYQPVTIGDFVWNDANANGIQDSGETGLTNLSVTLTGTDGAGRAVSLTTLTDTNGNYAFTVAPGTYTVAVSTPTGYAASITGQGTPSTDSSGSPAATTPAFLLSGGSDTNVDFGFYRAVVTVNSGSTCSGTPYLMTATITVGAGPFTYAWAGPNGFSAGTASINATDAGNYTVTVTDAQGAAGSASATLVVNATPVVTVNSGSVFQGNSLTLAASVSGGAAPYTYAWSGPAGFTASTASISVSTAGAYSVTVTDHNGCGGSASGNLAVILPVTIGNYVWNDANGNGVQDGSEGGIAGVTVTLTGTDIKGGAVSTSTVTDSNGLYSFSVPPGTYSVSVVTPAGYVATATGQGTAGTDSNPNGSTVTLADGGNDQSIDFGFYQAATIGDYVWNDANANGVQDAGETGLTNLMVTVTGTDGAGNAVSLTTLTGTNGNYSFTVAPGTYTVAVATPAGYAPTITGQGTPGTDSNGSPAATTPVVLASGGSDVTVDFGFYQEVVTVNSGATCAGTPYSLTASIAVGTGPYTYSWTGPNGFSAATSSISATDAGTYTVTVTDAQGAVATASGVLTVNALPTAVVNSTAICAGGSATLTATTAATNPSYLWSPGGATTASIAVSPSSTTTYSVTVTDGKTGCVSLPATGTVTVNPIPTASVNSTTICAGSSATLVATTTASAPVYLWTPGGATTASITVSPASTRTYSVTITDGRTGCVSVPAVGTVTVNPKPVVSVNSGATCAGSALTLAATVSSGTGPFTYAWTGPNGFTAATSSVSVTNAGTYAVTVTDSNGCTGNGSGVLTINAKPVVTVNSGAVPQGSALTMTATVGSGAAPYSYAWSGPAGFSATTASISVTNAGNYSVTVTDANGCTGTGSGVLTVNPKPSVTVNNGATCAGGSQMLTASVSSGTAPFTYVWSGPAGFTATTASISPTNAGTYSVTVTDANTYTATSSGVLTVYPKPVVSVNSGATCAGSALTLAATVTSGTGPFSYAWTGPNGFTAATSSVSVTNAGTYAVTVTDSHGCTGNGSGVLTVNAKPVVTVNSGAVPQGSALTMTATVGSGAAPYSYVWSGPAGFSATTASISVTNGGTYSVTVTDGNGCTGTGTGVLTVNAVPTVTVNGVTVNSGAVCSGSAFTFTAAASSGTAPFTYAWTGPAGFTGTTASISATNAGIYSVTATDAHGYTATGSGILTVNPKPVVVVNSATACSGSAATLTATATNVTGALTYAWTGPSSFTASTASISVTNPGTYTVTVTSASGCAGTGSGVLTVNPKPVVVVNSATVCSGSAATLTATVTNVTGALTYAWTGPSSFTASTASISVTNAGTYTVTVTSASGCTGTGAGVLTVNPKPVVVVNSATVSTGSAGTLTATVTNSTGALTYAWTGPSSFTASTSSISVTNAGTYTVTVTSSSGCTGTGSGVLTVSPKPVVVVNSATVCSGSAATLTATVTNVTGALSYAWTGPSGFTASTASISVTNAGTYTVTVTSSTGFTGTGSGVLTVNPKPLVAVNSAAVCTGSAATLTATVTNCTGALTYAWSGPSSFTASTASISVANPGTYTVTVTSASSCTGTGSGTVTLSAAPSAVITGPGTICPASLGNIYTAPAGLTYAWSITGGGSIVGSATAQSVSVSAASACSTNFVLTLKVTAAGGCTNTAAATVTVKSTTSPLMVCPANITLTNTVLRNYCTYNQSDWGAAPRNGNAGGLLCTNFSRVYTNGYCQVGSSRVLRCTTPTALQNCLPFGGSPGYLPTSYVNPTTCGAGTFSSRVLCLQLNVDFSDSSALPGCTGKLGDLVLQDTSSGCHGKSVRQILSLCNTALGGGDISTSGCSISDLDTLCDNLNNSCRGGTNNAWCTSHLGCGTNSSNLPLPSVTGSPTVTDSCDSTPTVTYSDSVVNGSCAGSMVITRTWKAVDLCGNTSTCTQTITLGDNVAPVLTCPPNITITNAAPHTYCSFSETNWNCTPSGYNAGSLLCTNFANVYRTNGCIQIGLSTNKWVKCTTANSVRNCLPSSGTPTKLTACYTNPATCGGGTFGSHVLCLQLNVDFNDSGVIPGCNGKFGDLVYHDSASLCDGKKVRDILNLCHKGLGGGDLSGDGCQVSDLDGLCDNLNRSCEGGKVSDWCKSHLSESTNCVPTTTQTGTATATDNFDAHPVITYSDVVTPGSTPGESVIFRTWKAVDSCGNVSTCTQTITISNPCGGSISGSVMRDCDSNGLINANDLGFTGVAVTLKNSNGVVVAATTTDNNGAYSFTGLVAGKYSVVVTSPVNCKQTYDPDAILDGIKSVTLTNCQSVSAVKFAYAGNTPSCSVTVRGPSSCHVGDTITYTCTVTNTGNSCYTGGVDVNSPDCGSWHFTYPTPLGPGQSCVFTKTYTTQPYDRGNFTCHATATGHCSPGIGDTSGNHYCTTQVNW